LAVRRSIASDRERGRRRVPHSVHGDDVGVAGSRCAGH
jgi:hypothetical protein